jgi:hypothetical protein
MQTQGATSAQHRRPAVARRFKSECTMQRGCFQFACETMAFASATSHRSIPTYLAYAR